MNITALLILFSVLSGMCLAKEVHVAKNGNNGNDGTLNWPLLTIQAAAEIAQPGDIITVHEGVYREWLIPPRGGTSNEQRIVYHAAKGEHVEIKGSEIIKGWKKFSGDVWKVAVPNAFFGEYNPYKDIIHGDWFNDLGRIHHTGDDYLNEKSMWEMTLLENVLHPKPQSDKFDPEGSTYTWFCESDDENTYIYANFHGANPNEETVEINVRRSCFYPEETGICGSMGGVFSTIENNILLSDLSIRDWSEGGAYLHNLIAGNIYLNRARPFNNEDNQLVLDYNPEINLKENDDGVSLKMKLPRVVIKMNNFEKCTVFLSCQSVNCKFIG